MHPDSQFDASTEIEPKALNLIWRQICVELSNRIGDQAYERWFSPLGLVRVNSDEVVISAPNSIYSIWVSENFSTELTDSVSLFLKNHGAVEFELLTSDLSDTDFDGSLPSTEEIPASSNDEERSPKRGKKLPSDQKRKNPTEKHHTCPDPEKLRRLGKIAGLNDSLLFENFVVGKNSEIAHAAATAVAEKPGRTYQPLFIHSAPGLGKTHLLHAIGWETLKLRPSSKVIYLTAESFVNDYISALRDNALVKFRKKYRNADLLLIDDIHFLARKDGMQEEFFHTFNSLTDSHRQIVLTSDRPASEISHLEERLVTRFQWGLATEIVSPEVETRAAILRRKRDEWNLAVTDEAVDFIAERIQSNVRLMEGALIRVGMVANLSETPLELKQVEETLMDLCSDEESRRVSVESIQDAVAEHYDLTTKELVGKRRTARVAEARHIAMFLSRQMTDHSLVEIGDFFCRDHGTVIHAVKKLRDKVETSSSVRSNVEVLRRRLARGARGSGPSDNTKRGGFDPNS